MSSVALRSSAAATLEHACAHCGLPIKGADDARFCCPGCAAAFAMIESLGLGAYYRRRSLDPAQHAPRPAPSEPIDLARYAVARADGSFAVALLVEGLQCGACVWLIESVLGREPAVIEARVNMTTGRLRLAWRGTLADGQALLARVEQLGYRLVPIDQASETEDRSGKALIRALAVAGFAAGNIMLLSIGIWAGERQGMGASTRDLLHWISALIALPSVAYAGHPFFQSALAALRTRHSNMDVPISIGILLVTAMSLVQTATGGIDTYFDSATALLFFLLIGRVLDHRARGRARQAAQQLIALRVQDAALIEPDGTIRHTASDRLKPGDRLLVQAGQRIPADGIVLEGESSLDTSLVTGETVPCAVKPGARLFAGTLNVAHALTVGVTAIGEATLLAEITRLIEAAESRRSRTVVLADRIARRYAPTVHLAALLTFLLWWGLLGAGWVPSLLIATSVLIITCPCALALAVPAAQIVASGRLFRSGILLKSPTALERLAEIDTVVFDKTGTLTLPEPALEDAAECDPEALALAGGLAAASTHPLARALAAASSNPAPLAGVIERPGEGLLVARAEGEIRLGSARFCGITAAPDHTGPELWLSRPGHAPVRFGFCERLRPEAAETIARLHELGIAVRLVSGDQAGPVARVAAALDIDDWQAGQTPVEKVAALETLGRQGHRVLMVGDGLNDGPALAAAAVSMSPTSAADLSQTVADLVFQGETLAPVARGLVIARRVRRTVRQNLAFALGYNLLMVPLAIAGLVTPWLAAAAMSSSSLVVMGNSLRLARGERG